MMEKLKSYAIVCAEMGGGGNAKILKSTNKQKAKKSFLYILKLSRNN